MGGKLANTNKLFQKFNDNITLTSSKKDSLRKSRNALREDIKDWFSEKRKKQPSFYWQGSFAMKTVVNPLSGGEYDLDDGVYLEGYSDLEISDWPGTLTVHNWVKNAVEDRTTTDPIDKATCIRVKYASGYHIDLPIYIQKDNQIYLAHKSEGWIVSDPKELRSWFIDNVKSQSEQLRSCVKFIKAWKDYKGIDLKGVEVTILVTENFDYYENRDDKSLKNTVENIIDTLNDKFECIKPVAPNENLFSRFNEKSSQELINELSKLKSGLEEAIAEDDEERASNILRECFGGRFPKG